MAKTAGSLEGDTERKEERKRKKIPFVECMRCLSLNAPNKEPTTS